MITKAPSSYDGKPIGTPTDAVNPYRAGVTQGLDQIERADAARKARNRAMKAIERSAIKALRRANWESQQRRDGAWWEYKQRRTRAMTMWRSIHNHGRTIAWCARVHHISEAQVFEELKWWERRKHRRRGTA